MPKQKKTVEEDARFDSWWEREGKHHNPFDLRSAFRAGRADARDCGCREGECESKPTWCRMAAEVARHDPEAM